MLSMELQNGLALSAWDYQAREKYSGNCFSGLAVGICINPEDNKPFVHVEEVTSSTGNQKRIVVDKEEAEKNGFEVVIQETDAEGKRLKLAAEIVELFENLLDEKGIEIPCADEEEQRVRYDGKNDAKVYGMEYYNLEATVLALL